MFEYFSSEDHLISSQADIQIKMLLFIYFSIALVALSSAKQLSNGPQILSEILPSSESAQKINKRSVDQEFHSYFTPEEIQALQAVTSSQDSGSIQSLDSGISEESYNELLHKFYAENLKPTPIEEPLVEPDHSTPNYFLPNEESVYNKKPNYKQLLMDQTKLSPYAQNVQKNKLNQLGNPSVTGSALFKPASGFNRNKDQRKEIEYILRNVQTDQSRQLNSLNQVRTQNPGRNEGRKKSAVEEDIENAWRQYETYEFERSNSPSEVSIQKLSANENQKITEEQKQIEYILRNGQVYRFENAPTKVDNEGLQSTNKGQNEFKVEREIDHFWRKQQDSQFQRSVFPVDVFNNGF